MAGLVGQRSCVRLLAKSDVGGTKMAKYDQKTKAEPLSPEGFIEAIENPQRRAEARQLLQIYGAASGYPARVYTGGMIGFGHYSYTYASGHSGTAMATGFAPRKAELSLYGLLWGEAASALLPQLGKVRAGVGCVYARKLADIDLAVLSRQIALGLDHLRGLYPVTPE